MRKTLELEEDVAAELETAVQATGLSFNQIVNEAVREGLAKVRSKLPVKAKPFQQRIHKMGLNPQIDYSKTSALLDDLDVAGFLHSVAHRK